MVAEGNARGQQKMLDLRHSLVQCRLIEVRPTSSQNVKRNWKTASRSCPKFRCSCCTDEHRCHEPCTKTTNETSVCAHTCMNARPPGGGGGGGREMAMVKLAWYKLSIQDAFPDHK